MDTSGYTAITRMTGLRREMDTIANNIANMSTSGYRREGLVFSEMVSELQNDEPSLSMADASVRFTNTAQGPLTMTSGTFDLAIEGPGFFLIETPEGEAITRSGAFTVNEQSELVAHDGRRVLDAGGAPIFIPPNAADVAIATDGTISSDGVPTGQIGLFTPVDPTKLDRSSGVRFTSDAGFEPIEGSTILQGFVESSNVNAVSEITRMIEVQHAYQLSQNFAEKEDERIRSVLSTLGR